MSDISKIKLANNTIVTLKDAQGRTDFSTLLGTNELKALGAAAWLSVDESVTENGTGAVTGGKIKKYVDDQIKSIIGIGEVVIDEAKGGEGDDKNEPQTTASEKTYKKLYLVADSQAVSGAYIEWLTIKDPETSKYKWEQIGSTQLDLTAYAKKATKLSDNLDLTTDHTTNEWKTELGLKKFAYADQGEGSVDTIDSIPVDELTVAGNATVTDTETTMTSKGDYTPEGSVTGTALASGSIAVVLDEAATALQDVKLDPYTPAGTIAAAKDGSFAALKSAAIESVDASTQGALQIAGTVSKPEIDVTAPEATFIQTLKEGDAAATFTEGAFTPASLGDGFYTAGTAYEITTGSVAYGEGQTNASFASEGIVAHMAEESEYNSSTGVDNETLVFNTANKAEAITAVAALNYVAPVLSGSLPVINVSTFNGGVKASDTFSAKHIMVVDAKANAISSVSAALNAAPTFTGNYYMVNTTSDTALKNVVFTGTQNANVIFNSANYLKQSVNATDTKFTGVNASLGFSGTAATLSVSGNYYRVNSAAAFNVQVTPVINASNIVRTAKTVVVNVKASS